jgi:dihydrofolate reductase
MEMRKLIVFLHASLDGMVEGPNGVMDIGWITYDGDMEKYAEEVLSTVDTVLWGKNTYLGMQGYWPTVPSNPEASPHEVAHAKWIEAATKIVFSTTLEHTDWNNSRLVRGNVVEEITKLKNQPGKDLIVLGSPRFAHHLMQLGLVDEFKMTISPVVLGQGLPYFKGIPEQMKLKLNQCKTFDSGAIVLEYERVR